MGNTTHFNGKAGGTVGLATAVYGKFSGNVLPAKYIYVRKDGVVKGVYSVLSASASSVDNITAHGASASGTPVSGTPGVTFSGNVGSVGFSWARIGGDSSTVCSNAASQNPTFSRLISGVANGTPSDIIGSTWRCTLTDGDTGATVAVDIACAVRWTNDIPAYTEMVLTPLSETNGFCEIGFAPGSCVATADIEMNVTGGGPSKTWLWEYISGDTVGVSHPATNGPNFYLSKSLFMSSAGGGESVAGQWRVTVSDGIGPSKQYTFVWNCGCFADND